LNAILKEISSALLSADVNVKQVLAMRNNVRNTVLMEEAPGTNKRKIIQQAVYNELTNMLATSKEPYKMKKGKPVDSSVFS
jgi:signal recognition particle subunit SRP54